MIDFHTHILPSVDDGSKSVDESIGMLQLEAKQNIETVFLTPHFYAEKDTPVSFLKKRYQSWRQLALYYRPDLPDIRLGAEVQYFEGITSVEDVKHLRIVGTDYLLLEMPFRHWSARMLDDVIEMSQIWNVTIVLAHIERYMAMQSSDVWPFLRNQGVLMQSNVSFFANWKTRKKAMSMLESGEIHFLGSDSHNTSTRSPNWDLLPDRARQVLCESSAFQKLQSTDIDGIHISLS